MRLPRKGLLTRATEPLLKGYETCLIMRGPPQALAHVIRSERTQTSWLAAALEAMAHWRRGAAHRGSAGSHAARRAAGVQLRRSAGCHPRHPRERAGFRVARDARQLRGAH